jgi:oligopeptide/dipeptide ABC transporter ATP-binding protein
MKPLLEVLDLHIAYRSGAGELYPALAGVSFELRAGEVLGVLGESGSGKSTLAASLLRVLPANGTFLKGIISFEGKDLLSLQLRELETIRGCRIGIVFQEPSLALHPTTRVREQIRDVIVAHESMDRRTSKEKTLKLLETLFATDAKRIGNSYAHQLSGGQRQRVLIAQAIACGPSLLIADEPTASLDPSTQLEILSFLLSLRQKRDLAMILITHSPAILARLADRVLVLYAGRVVETGPPREVLALPRHPYTAALLQSLPPEIHSPSLRRKTKLPAISGEPANLMRVTKGCCFEPRCPDRMEVCSDREPAEVLLNTNHCVSCFKYGG